MIISFRWLNVSFAIYEWPPEETRGPGSWSGTLLAQWLRSRFQIAGFERIRDSLKKCWNVLVWQRVQWYRRCQCVEAHCRLANLATALAYWDRGVSRAAWLSAIPDHHGDPGQLLSLVTSPSVYRLLCATVVICEAYDLRIANPRKCLFLVPGSPRRWIGDCTKFT